MTETTRHLAQVRRADGTLEDVTFAIVETAHSIGAGDFRTTDGEPLILGPRECIEIDLDRVIDERHDEPPLAW
jgi:hypothetical protein